MRNTRNRWRAVPYAAVYAAGLYRFAMDESEKDMVRSVVRKIRR